MSQTREKSARRRRHSLSLRVTTWLVAAALFPLFITVGISEYLTRPALVDKANTQMESDAKTRVQLIDNYFQERLFDVQTLTQIPSAQSFLALPPQTQMLDPLNYAEQKQHALYALGAGMFRDKNYTTWALFNKQGKPVLTYPQPGLKAHGHYIVAPEYLQAVQQGKTFISDVYYDANSQKATVDIYSPMISLQPYAYLGFARASLSQDTVWNIVRDGLGSNGDNSYAFILDENGVRIADTSSRRLFTSVAPLPSETRQRVQKEALYGSNGNVPILMGQAFADTLHNDAQTSRFVTQPIDLNEPYQVVQRAATKVPWHYFILSPVGTVTAFANQQMLITGATAFAVSLLVAIIGLLVGRNLGRPILTSVESLLGNSAALSTLAAKQKDAASEQMWVVDSSQVGLQAVQYYTEAMAVAAQRLSKTGIELVSHGEQVDAYTARQALIYIVASSQYIEQAAKYQGISTHKLATALKVATQVTEQLVTGTTSATRAAAQLESVVEQLQDVVGK